MEERAERDESEEEGTSRVRVCRAARAAPSSGEMCLAARSLPSARGPASGQRRDRERSDFGNGGSPARPLHRREPAVAVIDQNTAPQTHILGNGRVVVDLARWWTPRARFPVTCLGQRGGTDRRSGDDRNAEARVFVDRARARIDRRPEFSSPCVSVCRELAAPTGREFAMCDRAPLSKVLSHTAVPYPFFK